MSQHDDLVAPTGPKRCAAPACNEQTPGFICLGRRLHLCADHKGSEHKETLGRQIAARVRGETPGLGRGAQ